MKIVVYLVMFLLIGPVQRFAGVAVTGLYLLTMAVIGVVLLVRRSGRDRNAPQQPVAPAVYGYGAPAVYVVVPPATPAHPSAGWSATAWDARPLAAHPAYHWPQQNHPQLGSASYRVPPGGAPPWVYEGQR
ncbi:MAG: hypothetical protein AB7G47_20015 [Mycolicibacterium sp.]|uniref:hypothetical protein n=1 Tax=Mycolicibacterium sp. TaxID=2320850 RepID=UPI003D0E72E6